MAQVKLFQMVLLVKNISVKAISFSHFYIRQTSKPPHWQSPSIINGQGWHGQCSTPINVNHKLYQWQPPSTQFLFLPYTDTTRCKGNSASAALNKWLKAYTEQGVIRSFRHSFRDRLRAADIDTEFVDQLGGWAILRLGYLLTSRLIDQCYNAWVLRLFWDNIKCKHSTIFFSFKWYSVMQ